MGTSSQNPNRVETTQGCVAIRAIPTSKIVERCGCSERSARNWKAGRLPSDRARAAIEREFGIRAALFFLKAPTNPAAVRRLSLSPEALVEARETIETITTLLTREDLSDEARTQLESLSSYLGRAIAQTEHATSESDADAESATNSRAATG
jgi:hypothetical protein